MSNDASPDLIAHLNAEAERARNARKPDEIRDALDFYRGEPYGNEVAGRSRAVTRDVAEVVDQAVVNILETMVAGEYVVTFETDADVEPTQENPNPIDPGEQATDAIHYWFMRRQSGYRVLHDACKAGLMEREGVCKTFVERRRTPQRFEVPALALSSPDFNYDEIEETDRFAPEFEDGDEAGRIYVATQYVEAQPVIRDVTVPYEEFFCSPDARDFDTSPYLKHERSVTLSELREMGLVMGQDSLPSGLADESLKAARDRGQSTAVGQGVNRLYLLSEEYTYFDLNGDGIAERICVYRVASEVLDVFEVEAQPFSGWTPFPMQHRWSGDSLADKTLDIQVINSTLMRNGLDSLYLSLAPRTALHESAVGETTIDDMLDTAPGTIVRWKGAVKPEALLTQDRSANAFQAIEFMLTQRDSRTGINRHSQGLNPDSLNKTFGGMAMLQDNSDKVLKYLARNFAEMLVAPMFAKRYQLMRQFQQPFTRKIDGQKVVINPSSWPEEIDVTINVGLGSNRREQRVQGRITMLEVQKEAVAAGLRIVSEEHLYNSIRGLARDLAIGSPNDFAADPATLRPAEEKPDPAQIETMAKAQQESQRLELERWKAEQDIALRREEMLMEEARERDRMDREFALAAERLATDQQQTYRPGGALDR